MSSKEKERKAVGVPVNFLQESAGKAAAG